MRREQDRRRFWHQPVKRWQIIAAYAVIVAIAFFAVREDRINDHDLVESTRQSCERHNVLRENQWKLLQEQVRLTEASLKGDLGNLEPFRSQIVEQNESRKRGLQNLIESVQDHPQPGAPYKVDCEEAHP